ncbi:MAG TPA: DeoR/GlpR family DNA-binding transcription regulator [Gryllotalpicola sp.]
MLAHQREEAILGRLREIGSVSAQELVRLLDVSAPTVRRDLERLEGEGLLRRVHGGALSTQEASGGDEAPFGAVTAEFAPEKDAIAVAAAALVEDGQVVLLDIGTTTARIARQLRGRAVTVITSSLAVLDELRNDEAVELVLLGGTVRRNFQTVVGPLTEDAIASVSADLAFLSCTGVRADGAIVDDISREASIKRAIAKSAGRLMLVATAAKFPGTGAIRIAQLEEMDAVITTASADHAPLNDYAGNGGKVIAL